MPDEPCTSEPLGGGKCDLPKGHDGKHFKAFKHRDGGFEWDDESQSRLASRYGSRFY